MGNSSRNLIFPLVAGTSFTFLLFLILLPLAKKSCLPLCPSSQPNTLKESEQGRSSCGPSEDGTRDPLGASQEDLEWARAQLRHNSLEEEISQSPEQWHMLRKGINPRTREEQLTDLRKYKGVSHYSDGRGNATALPCPGELLVEEHHSNYGEPWAGGRDVFEFLAKSVRLKPHHNVLEVGCGTLRVGLHFVRYLEPARYHCVERDPLSLLAALRYELPAQGLLYKRPTIIRGEDMDFDQAFGNSKSGIVFDLIYASAVFLHMPDKLVWKGLQGLAPRLVPGHGRLYVSHNVKFCTRLPAGVCQDRLAKLDLEYVEKHTHDSLLFNHYEIWFEFKRISNGGGSGARS